MKKGDLVYNEVLKKYVIILCCKRLHNRDFFSKITYFFNGSIYTKHFAEELLVPVVRLNQNEEI